MHDHGQATRQRHDRLLQREREEKEVKRLGGGGSEPPDIDPIILGLLERLPKPGNVWPEAERKLWLELLSGSFKLIYRDKDEAAN